MKYMIAHKITLNAYTSQWSKILGNFCSGSRHCNSLFQSTTLYILCNPGLVLVQQILLSLFSYHTIAQLALKTINICRQAAMCLVPALASHCQTSLCYTSLNQVGEKGRQLCPETKIKAGNYLKVNIFISYY